MGADLELVRLPARRVDVVSWVGLVQAVLRGVADALEEYACRDAGDVVDGVAVDAD